VSSVRVLGQRLAAVADDIEMTCEGSQVTDALLSSRASRAALVHPTTIKPTAMAPPTRAKHMQHQ